MGTVRVCFLWHFHQPEYRDLATGRALLPWVRLHAGKDYLGMARLLEECPEMKVTANFTPVLLDQLEAYVGGADDELLSALREFPEGMDEERREWVRKQLRIGPWKLPRNNDLDLAVQGTLSWVHPLVDDELIRELRAKGHGYTAQDLDQLLDLHRDIAGRVVLAWKKLAGVEIMTSPYAHPILPLLLDMPELADDARRHLDEARQVTRRMFGAEPMGLWPSEGSVSEDTVRLAGECGFQWLATDEEILKRSGGGDPHRPYRFGDVTMFFRDHELSDRIGFTYRSWEPEKAAADLIGRLEAMPDGATVTIALDGENAWEHYPEGGVPFLRRVYRGIVESKRLVPSTFSEATADAAPLERLHAGSWINADFAIWNGHDEDKRAWKLLAEVRGRVGEKGWRSIAAAEGSDWFWWFGDEFTSAHAAEFDMLFRRHLLNACRDAGVAPPDAIHRPIKQIREESAEPWAICQVVIDGRRTDYFEWISAGRVALDTGAMAGDGLVTCLYYGFDTKHLYLRLDFQAEPPEGEIRLVQLTPVRREVAIRPPSGEVRSAYDDILEAAVPFDLLGVKPGQQLRFFIECAPHRWPALSTIPLTVPPPEFEQIHWHV